MAIVSGETNSSSYDCLLVSLEEPWNDGRKFQIPIRISPYPTCHSSHRASRPEAYGVQNSTSLNKDMSRVASDDFRSMRR